MDAKSPPNVCLPKITSSLTKESSNSNQLDRNQSQKLSTKLSDSKNQLHGDEKVGELKNTKMPDCFGDHCHQVSGRKFRSI